MPELPDVEVLRQYCQSTSLHQKILETSVMSEQILENTPERQVKSYLQGKKFNGTDRHGKYLFLDVADSGWLVLHFGMTGGLRYFQDQGKVPQYTQALFEFEDNWHLALIMPRKLGALYLADQRDDFVREKGLGPDVCGEDFDEKRFLKILEKSRAMIKSDLMNQEKMAGIGNVYSDEILYQSKIHPRIKTRDLNKSEKERIYKKLNDVIRVTIDCKANPDEFPEYYLTPHREEGAPCPRCGTKIVRKKVLGRSSYLCPACQGREG